MQPQPAAQPDGGSDFQKRAGLGCAFRRHGRRRAHQSHGRPDGLGLVATCNPGGAGKWAAQYTTILSGADVVVVMEKRHKERLQQKFPEELAAKPCVCLFIADDYEFMDANLIEILRGKMREHFPAIE